MKTIRLLAFAGFVVMLTIAACQREIKNLTAPAVATASKPQPVAVCNSNAYTITLESKTLVSGNWEWVWSIFNPNPGNGTNGTSQDMSHWGMQFGQCFNWQNVVGAAYSTNGTSWTSFTPVYQVDPSQSCVTTPVLKYNVGTTGTAKTYYRLVLNANYAIGSSFGYYKSGVRMPCCTFTFNGVGCPEQIALCSYSQGYWFAKPTVQWCQNVVFGSNSYTQTQGKTIWTDAPPTSVAKKAFTQASALKLSMQCVHNGAAIPAGILSAYTTCANFLAGLTYNQILTGAYAAGDYPAVAAAAGAIGDWIPLHHCDEEGD